MKKPPKLVDYDGKGDPDEYVVLVDERLSYFSDDKTSNASFLHQPWPNQKSIRVQQLSR